MTNYDLYITARRLDNVLRTLKLVLEKVASENEVVAEQMGIGSEFEDLFDIALDISQQQKYHLFNMYTDEVLDVKWEEDEDETQTVINGRLL